MTGLGGPTVRARAVWPEPGDGALPPLPGFVHSAFNPLVAAVADRCLRRAYRAAPAVDGERTAIVLVSPTGDEASAAYVKAAVAADRRPGPLFFFQSVPNSVAGQLAARWGLGGPVVCLAPTGDPRAAGFAEADLLLYDGDADAVLLILIDTAPDDGDAESAVAVLLEGGATMKPRGIRGLLAADNHVGAGNVLERVLAHGADPDTPCLTFDTPLDGHPAETTLTLGQLDRRVAARAAWLHERGIGPRDPVAVWATAVADTVLSYLALTRLGAIPALMNGQLPPTIAAEYIRRLRGVAVLADEAHRTLLTGHDLGVPVLGTPAEAGSGDPDAAPAHYRHHPDDPIVITHTSGTTGVPKAVLHSHASLFAATRHLLSMPQAQGTSRILSALPAPHTATVLMVNQVLGNRSEMLLLSEQGGERVLDAIQRWRPDGVFGFSVTWAELARCELAGYDLDSVRLWFNTGDSSHEPHIRHLVAVGSRDVMTRTGVTRVPGSVFIDGLGSSEMGHSVFHITHTQETERYGRCIGRPYRFTKVAVLDAAGEPVPTGEAGWLGIDSPSLFRGYWNDSVTTHRYRQRGWYLTGDLVYADADGWYYHLDRAVDSVDSVDGKRFYTALSEERILAACPDVTDCTVVMVREPAGVVTDVLLELATGADETTDRTAAVREALGGEVGATLRRVVPVRSAELPVTVTGKVRKVALRERYLSEASR